jgi:hypothetical protein
VTSFSPEGDPLSYKDRLEEFSFRYHYDSVGRKDQVLTATTNILRSEEGYSPISIELRRNQFDAAGRLRESMLYSLPGDSLTGMSRYAYDEFGMLASVESFAGDGGVPVERVRLNCHAGRISSIIKETLLAAVVRHRIIDDYDSNGFLIKRRFETVSDSIASDIDRGWKSYQNDRFGNPVLEIDSLSEALPDTTTFAYVYDSCGNWTQRRTYANPRPRSRHGSYGTPFVNVITRQILYYSGPCGPVPKRRDRYLMEYLGN